MDPTKLTEPNWDNLYALACKLDGYPRWDVIVLQAKIARSLNKGVSMFTKQHYVAVANLLRQHRAQLLANPTSAIEQARIDEHNDVVMRFVGLFKADNPKFKDLVFIGEACADVASNARQE